MNNTTSPAPYSHIVEGFSEVVIFYSWADKLTAAILAICVAVGTPLNALSLVYFSRCRGKEWWVLNRLYTLISLTDGCTCLTVAPVLLCLLCDRQPMIFKYKWACEAWELVYSILPTFSIFLVATLALSRSLRIIRPYKSVSINSVITAIGLYVAFLVIVTVLNFAFEERYYVKELSFCIGVVAGRTYSHFKNVALAAQIGIPSIIVFVCFIISLRRIRLIHSNSQRSRTIKHRVSVTVTLFTGIFLVCNAPLFLNTTVLLAAQWLTGEFPSGIYSSPFMASYSWLIVKILCPAVNSILNPLLYMTRVTEFGDWLKGKKEVSETKREESVKLSD